MVMICTLGTFSTWIACAESGLPLTETISIVVFFVALIGLKVVNIRETLPFAFFIATFVAGTFLGLGLINPLFVLAGVILTAASAVFLRNQNNP